MWVEIRPFSRRQVWEKLEISVCRGNICRNAIGLHTVDSHTIGSHNSIMQQCYNDFMELSVPNYNKYSTQITLLYPAFLHVRNLIQRKRSCTPWLSLSNMIEQ